LGTRKGSQSGFEFWEQEKMCTFPFKREFQPEKQTGKKEKKR
jgi:hypothetical protein